MFVRADQLRIGDHLRVGELDWVLPTPDQQHLVFGLRRWRRVPTVDRAHVTRQYRLHGCVELLGLGRRDASPSAFTEPGK